MADFIKEFSIDEIVKNSDTRRFSAYGTVELYDRHNQLLPIKEFYKSMDNYMANSRILLDSHTNKPVGKTLNWYPAQKDGKEAIKITGEIFSKGRASDKVWKEIKEGYREGISVGGSSEEIEKTSEGEIVTGIEIDEFSIVRSCGNQGATFNAVSMAKSDEISKQTNDMEQTSEDEGEDISGQKEEIEELKNKISTINDTLEELKSLVLSRPQGDLKMTEEEKQTQETQKSEEQKAEVTSQEDVSKKENTEETQETQKSEETNSEENVQKEEQTQETEKSFDFEKFAKEIQEKIDNLNKEVQGLKKSGENVEVAKTDKPDEKPVEEVSKGISVSEINKSVANGEITPQQAMKKIMGDE